MTTSVARIHVGPKATVIGLDRCTHMLRLASSFVASKFDDAPPLIFRADVQNKLDLALVLGDQKFDRIITNGVFPFFEREKQAALLQLWSSYLKPGGRLVVDILHPDKCVATLSLWSMARARRRSNAKGDLATYVFVDYKANIPAIREAHRLAAAAGLRLAAACKPLTAHGVKNMRQQGPRGKWREIPSDKAIPVVLPKRYSIRDVEDRSGLSEWMRRRLLAHYEELFKSHYGIPGKRAINSSSHCVVVAASFAAKTDTAMLHVPSAAKETQFTFDDNESASALPLEAESSASESDSDSDKTITPMNAAPDRPWTPLVSLNESPRTKRNIDQSLTGKARRRAIKDAVKKEKRIVRNSASTPIESANMSLRTERDIDQSLTGRARKQAIKTAVKREKREKHLCLQMTI